MKGRVVLVIICLILNIYSVISVLLSLMWNFLNRSSEVEYSISEDIQTIVFSIWIIIVLCIFSFFLIKELSKFINGSVSNFK